MNTFTSTLRDEIGKYDKREAYIANVVKNIDHSTLIVTDITYSLASTTSDNKLNTISRLLIQTMDYEQFTQLICLYIMQAKLDNDLQQAIKRLIILIEQRTK